MEGIIMKGPYDFYAARYAPERQKLRDAIFREVYDDYIGQSSWLSTADYDRCIGWLDVTPRARVLDIACGGGGPTLRLARLTGCSVVGIDSNAQALASAAALAQAEGISDHVRFECHDASQTLAFPDGAFDAVICFDALMNLPNRPRILAEWARVLVPGGRLVFTDQVMTGPISNEEIAARTIGFYFLLAGPGYDERLLQEAGFKLLRHEDMTDRMHQIAERHCASRKAHADALRAAEGEEEFGMQNRYRAVAGLLAREHRLSHFAFLATSAKPAV
jgi:ubiquinone/menaquinone biosynthesis C-methylase UbiE